MPNKLWGHLPIIAECQKLLPEEGHPQSWPEYIRLKYNLPEVFYVDLRPFGPVWIYVCDPDLIGQYVTTAQSLPKSIWEVKYFLSFLGKNSLVILEGDRWRSLRSMFNPGFSTANILTLVDNIVDTTLIFRDIMYEKVRTNEVFQLEEYASRLTMDIIGRVVIDADMNSQKQVHPISRAFRARVKMMRRADAVLPWEGFDLFRPLKLWWNRRKLDGAVGRALDERIIQRAVEIQAGTCGKKRSVVDLALASYEKEMSIGGVLGEKKGVRITSPNQLSKRMRDDLVDSFETFFFAGHDTSSSVIAWMFYLLHRYPEVKSKLVAELDNLFPPGSDAAITIKENSNTINKMEYTTAVIKETMRLFPAGNSLRWADPANPPAKSVMIDTKTGTEYPMLIPGASFYPSAHMVHRNTRFYPKPTEFIPERWIQSMTPFPEAELFNTRGGKEAFRAFEKGPRNCIGQELAMIEIKIVTALTIREFDFIVEYPGEKPDIQFPIPESLAAEHAEGTEYGDAVRNGMKRDRMEGHRAYSVLKGSAKPAGGCPGRIYAIERAGEVT